MILIIITLKSLKKKNATISTFFFIFEYYSQLLFRVININLLIISITILLFSLLGLYMAYDYYLITKPMTGVRCSTCIANGQESWVIPGKKCGYCGRGC